MPPVLILATMQVGLYLVVRKVFASRPKHKRHHQLLKLTLLTIKIFLPDFFLLNKANVNLPGTFH